MSAFGGKADITLKVPSGMMPVNDASICNLAVTFAFKAGGPLNCSNWLRLLDRHYGEHKFFGKLLG